MNYILDPKADYGKPVLKRGLIIGDVQSEMCIRDRGQPGNIWE